MLWPVELGREESRRCLQNRIGPSQFSVLSPQAFQLSGLFGRDPGTRAGINLDLAHPLAHRLRAAAPSSRATSLIAAHSDSC